MTLTGKFYVLWPQVPDTNLIWIKKLAYETYCVEYITPDEQGQGMYAYKTNCNTSKQSITWSLQLHTRKFKEGLCPELKILFNSYMKVWIRF